MSDQRPSENARIEGRSERDGERHSTGSMRDKVLLGGGIALLILSAIVLLAGSLPFGEQQRPGDAPLQPLVAGTASLIGTPSALPSGPVVEEAAPGFSLQALSGEEIRLGELRGRPVVINFWATWCAPCIFEMPELQAAHEGDSSEALVLGINYREDTSTVNAFLAEDLQTTITFPILLDEEGTVAEKYAVLNLPTTYFIDKNGQVSGVHRGPLTLEQIEDYLSGM